MVPTNVGPADVLVELHVFPVVSGYFAGVADLLGVNTWGSFSWLDVLDVV